MSLPEFTAYALPRQAQLPPTPVPWLVDARRAALLVHDMQNYFLRPYMGREPIPEVIENVRALAQAARAAGMPVIYTRQPAGQSPARRGLLMELWGPGPGSRPDDGDITTPLHPQAADHVVVKHRYSAFHATPLADLLAAEGRDQLMVTGIYAHIGCLLTCADAFMRDISPFFVADATADFDAEHHTLALRNAATLCAQVTTTQAALRALHVPGLEDRAGQ
ncbi:isochorismatase family protein [Streptomyces sp. NPDC101150]|uniref:isochorismatase family protein n=1 Tax=Streptomyces sp. NPDC101150 TaxID=3366114 RepID=UPI0038173C3E